MVAQIDFRTKNSNLSPTHGCVAYDVLLRSKKPPASFHYQKCQLFLELGRRHRFNRNGTLSRTIN